MCSADVDDLTGHHDHNMIAPESLCAGVGPTKILRFRALPGAGIEPSLRCEKEETHRLVNSIAEGRGDDHIYESIKI